MVVAGPPTDTAYPDIFKGYIITSTRRILSRCYPPATKTSLTYLELCPQITRSVAGNPPVALNNGP